MKSTRFSLCLFVRRVRVGPWRRPAPSRPRGRGPVDQWVGKLSFGSSIHKIAASARRGSPPTATRELSASSLHIWRSFE